MCQTKGRFSNTRQCCLKNSSRSQAVEIRLLRARGCKEPAGYAPETRSLHRRERGAPADAPPPDAHRAPTEGRRCRRGRRARSDRPTRAAQASGSRAGDPPRPATARSSASVDPRRATASGHPTTAQEAGRHLFGDAAPVVDVERDLDASARVRHLQLRVGSHTASSNRRTIRSAHIARADHTALEQEQCGAVPYRISHREGVACGRALCDDTPPRLQTIG